MQRGGECFGADVAEGAFEFVKACGAAVADDGDDHEGPFFTDCVEDTVQRTEAYFGVVGNLRGIHEYVIGFFS